MTGRLNDDGSINAQIFVQLKQFVLAGIDRGVFPFRCKRKICLWPEDMAMGIPGSFGQGEFRFGRVGMEGQIIWRWGHGYPRKYRQAPGRQRHIWRPC